MNRCKHGLSPESCAACLGIPRIRPDAETADARIALERVRAERHGLRLPPRSVALEPARGVAPQPIPTRTGAPLSKEARLLRLRTEKRESARRLDEDRRRDANAVSSSGRIVMPEERDPRAKVIHSQNIHGHCWPNCPACVFNRGLGLNEDGTPKVEAAPFGEGGASLTEESAGVPTPTVEPWVAEDLINPPKPGAWPKRKHRRRVGLPASKFAQEYVQTPAPEVAKTAGPQPSEAVLLLAAGLRSGKPVRLDVSELGRLEPEEIRQKLRHLGEQLIEAQALARQVGALDDPPA